MKDASEEDDDLVAYDVDVEDKPKSYTRSRVRGNGQRLTATQWEEIKAHWAMGTKTIDELGRMYQKDAVHLWRRLRDAGIKKGQDAPQAGDNVRAAVIDQSKTDARRIVETKEQSYAYVEGLSKLIMSKIVDANRNGKLGSIEGEIKTLERAMNAIARGRSERWVLLGLDKLKDDDAEIPELIVQEMTAKEIEKAKRQFNQSELDDVVNLGEETVAAHDDEDDYS